MEVRKGYKNTEVGVIPKDWEVKEFGQITEKIVGGGTPSRQNPNFWGGNIPWTTVKDFATFNPYQTQEYITIDGLKNSSSNLIPKRTIITSTRMGLGKAVIYQVDVAINQDLKAIFPKKNIDSIFLLNWFYFFSKTIEDMGSGSTVMGLSLNDLRKIKLAIPPTKSEQTAIATALSDTDALIESLENLIAKKRLIKQGAMQELLKPKEGWKVKRLGDVGKCHRGVSYNPERDLHSHDKDITLRLLRSNNIQNGSLDFDGLQFVDCERVKTNQILQENDIILCMANGSKQLVGKSAIFSTKDNLKYTFGAFMGCFRTNESLASSEYIAVNFQSYQYRNYIDVLLSGSSINNLNPGNIESIVIPFPSIEEQTRIATILSDMIKEIEALEAKLEKYRKIKVGMMQQLLTGKIRLV